MNKMRCVYAVMFITVAIACAYCQDADSALGFFDGVWYPNLRLGADMGLSYEMDAIGTGAYSYDPYSGGDQEWVTLPLYQLVNPGFGGILHAGLEAEFLSLWHEKGLVGGEAYAVGGYLSAGSVQQYLVGAGLGCTLFWVGKMLMEFGYSGSIGDVSVPSAYLGGNSASSYVFQDRTAGGFYFAMDAGLESPTVIVPGLSAFIFYRFFEVAAAASLPSDDAHDYGYWLVRNGLRAGLSYKIGPTKPLSGF